MMKKIVNKPLAETFGWLHVGGTSVELPDVPERREYRLAAGETRTVVCEEEAAFAQIDAELAGNACPQFVQIDAELAGNACPQFVQIDAELAGNACPQFVQIDAELAENACLHLVQIGHSVRRTCSDIRVRCGKNAAFHWYRLIFDGQESYDNCSVSLVGERSSFAADIGYRLDGSKKYDVNCEAIHLGRHTESRITSSGVLTDTADKLLRGTIDFRSGCSGSVGRESEDVLLLSEDVHNRSVPVILCSEEDVVGDHGASIGRPDENLLYYMESRGIEANAALDMLAQAKLEAVISRLPGAALQERIREKYL